MHPEGVWGFQMDRQWRIDHCTSRFNAARIGMDFYTAPRHSPQRPAEIGVGLVVGAQSSGVVTLHDKDHHGSIAVGKGIGQLQQVPAPPLRHGIGKAGQAIDDQCDRFDLD
jgi:hypothetical protein